ncbi:MAG: hypothetical protein HZB38_14390 [Planctomycetes bacterium]|nr:hypothetical protein [Planctomycetota bacterium]
MKAYANWSYLTWFPGDISEATVVIAGQAVVGAMTASTLYDTEWGYDHVASYSADVTAIVAAAGPGDFVIESATDDPNTLAFGEGFTLLVVYDDSSTLRHVRVYLGGINSSAFSLGTGWGYMQMQPSFQGGPLHFFVNALDGQDTLYESFYVNGVSLGGVITGGSGDNAFVGSEGPPPVAAGEVRYDRAEGDIAAHTALGATQVIFETIGPFNQHDAIGHTIGALAYASACPQDVTGDNQVNLDDLTQILSHFGLEDTGFADGDIDGDRDVDISDLAGVLSDYGISCP